MRNIITPEQSKAMLEEVAKFEAGELEENEELTEEALDSAFTNEVQPWLRRRLETFMGEIDKEMLALMKGQKFPEKRMEYGITRYAPLSLGPQKFLKSLGKPYRAWRAKVRTAIEGK